MIDYGKGTRRARTAPETDDPDTDYQGTDYPGAFPNSRKVHVDGPNGVRVPMREIHLSGGEPSLRVYDTSGPLGVDVRLGLPEIREEWIRSRPVSETGRSRVHHSDVEMPEGLGTLKKTFDGLVPPPAVH